MIMTVAMMTSLFPAAGFAAEMQPAGNVEATVTEPATNDSETTPVPTAEQTVEDWAGLKSALENATEATTIQLPAALESDETITLPEGADITLVADANGTTITRSSASKGEFNVPANAKLTMTGNITLTCSKTLSASFLTIAGTAVLNGKIQIAEDVQSSASLIDCTGSLTMNDGAEVSGIDANDSSGATAAVKISGEGAEFTINGGTITNNHEKGGANSVKGGAVQVLNGAKMTMNNGEIKSNNHDDPDDIVVHGGGIYVDAASVEMNGGTITDNQAFQGAGVYLTENSSFTMKGGSISGNGYANRSKFAPAGGGIYAGDGCTVTIQSADKEHPATISDNKTLKTGNYVQAQGGGIFATGENTKVILKDAVVSGNTSAMGSGIAGGGIYVEDDASLDITGSTITENMGYPLLESLKYESGGGGIVADGAASVAITGSTISDNVALYGSGLYLSATPNVTITNSTISGNESTWDETYTGWYYNSCMAGGIFFNDSDGTLTITDSAINENSAEEFGGGIIIASGTTTITGSIFDANTSPRGGAIYTAGTVNISDSQITGNTASNKGVGGGIYVNQTGNLTLTNTEVGNNTAYEAAGIANIGTVSFESGAISNNSAELAGGIENAGTFTLQGGTIAGNKATGDDVNANEGIGGGIVNTGTFTQTGGKIYGNIAKTGADDFYNFADTSTTGTFTLLDPSTFGVGADKWYEDAPNDRYTSGGDNASYESFTANTESHYLTLGLGDVLNTITVTPADITIYMGGTDGYDGVVDEDGTITGSNSLPEPGFTVTLPEALKDVPVTELTFKEANDASDKTWKFVPYDGNPATTVYKLVPQGEGQEATRVEFTNGSETITSDAFDVGENVNTTYTMSLYKGDGESAVGDIVTEYEGKTYSVDSSATATLTVRGTTDEPQLATVGTTPEKGKPAVSAPEGTTYAINGGNVAVQNPAGVSLLFDDIIDTNSENRTDLLKKKANEKLGGDASDRNMEIKYLDLVDAHNGNAWVKASQNVTIYWPIPEGASAEDSFKVLHFENLHRDMQSTNIESAITNCTVTEVPCTVEGDHITFQMGEDGFSPFALVWEEKSEPSWPDWPDWPPVGPGDDDDDNDDGDDNDNPPILNTEDHFSYVVGYEDGMVKPQRSITRAEVATIFYRLLEDDVRDDYDTTRNNFSDVTYDSWYNQTVSTLASMGILKGYEDGTFRPNASITRAEFAAIATRFFEETGATYEPGTFTDVTGSEWFAGAIMDAVNLGLIGGYEDGTVRPNNNITRAEACAIVNRTLGRVPDADHLLPADEMTTWPDNPSSAWFYADMQEATNGHEYEWITEDGNKVENWIDLLDKDWNDRSVN